LNAKEIITDFCKRVLVERSSNLVFPNIYLGSWEADILEVTKAGYTYEYEVKISKSDFKADFTKCKKKGKGSELKSDHIKCGKRTTHFYYLCPDGLLSVEEIPEYAGLIYAKKYDNLATITFRVMKPSPKLNKTKLADKLRTKLLMSTYHRYHNVTTLKEK